MAKLKYQKQLTAIAYLMSTKHDTDTKIILAGNFNDSAILGVVKANATQFLRYLKSESSQRFQGSQRMIFTFTDFVVLQRIVCFL